MQDIPIQTPHNQKPLKDRNTFLLEWQASHLCTQMKLVRGKNPLKPLVASHSVSEKMKGEDDVISKSIQFHIRLSKQEYQKIQSNSKRANLTMSQFARRALTGEIIQEAKPIDYYRLYNEINKIGVNINQIAKIANTTKSIDEASMKEIRCLLIKIYCLLDEGVR